MKVIDLIRKLKEFDPEADLAIEIDDSWQNPDTGTWWNETKIIDLTSSDFKMRLFDENYERFDEDPKVIIDLTW